MLLYLLSCCSSLNFAVDDITVLLCLQWMLVGLNRICLDVSLIILVFILITLTEQVCFRCIFLEWTSVECAATLAAFYLSRSKQLSLAFPSTTSLTIYFLYLQCIVIVVSSCRRQLGLFYSVQNKVFIPQWLMAENRVVFPPSIPMINIQLLSC